MGISFNTTMNNASIGTDYQNIRNDITSTVQANSSVTKNDSFSKATMEVAEGNIVNDMGNAQMSSTERNIEDSSILNEKIKKSVEEINKKMNNTQAEYGFDGPTNRVTIKIVDKDTKEVIKEFPPEKTLEMIARIWEMAGLMVDEKR